MCVCVLWSWSDVAFTCSVESSEIDLSEFQEENRDDGGAENNGAGQDEAHPSSAAPEPASGNPGGTISLVLLLIHFLIQDLLNN